jgi:hypothetical protein
MKRWWHRLARWWRTTGDSDPQSLIWARIAATFPPIFTANQWAMHQQLAATFLRHKRFWGADGLTVTPEMAATVAFGAACYAHRAGIAIFDDFIGIVLYPAPFQVLRRWEDETGVVHEWPDTLEGETWAQGPVVLSWLSDPSERWAVVIHEFAHRFDAALGGIWNETWLSAWERAAQEPAHLPFSPEALEDPGEFIAYTAETFFLAAPRLKTWDLGLYSLWCQLTGLDPAAVTQVSHTNRKEPS